MKYTDRQIIILVALAVSLPLFFIGIKGHDAVNHLIISRLFADEVMHGSLYPQWLFGTESGFGAPVLYFFPPLQYYALLPFYPLKYVDAYFKLPEGYLALYSSATMAIILSGFAFYQLIKTYTDEIQTGRAATIFYIVSAYHLMDLYHRFALAEIWAFVFLPLCLYYLKTNSFSKFVLSFAALILTHLFTVIMFLPVLVVMIMIEKQPRFFFGILIAAAITAFYWLPAYVYEPYISNPDGTGIYSIGLNFLSFKQPVIMLAAVPIILVFVTTIIASLKYRSFETSFWLLVAAGCIFLSLSLSANLWQLLVPLHKLSFPWRFLIIGSIASAILFIKIPEKYHILIIILSLACAIPGLLIKNNEDPNKYLSGNTLTLDNFRNRWTPQSLVVKDGFKDASKLQKLKFPGITIIPKNREFLVIADRAGLVTLPQFYFPTWKSDYELTPDPNTGLLRVNLPEPDIFTVKLIRSKIEWQAIAISFGALLILLLKNRLLRIFGISS